jgi:hypothetical protein
MGTAVTGVEMAPTNPGSGGMDMQMGNNQKEDLFQLCFQAVMILLEHKPVIRDVVYSAVNREEYVPRTVFLSKKEARRVLYRHLKIADLSQISSWKVLLESEAGLRVIKNYILGVLRHKPLE